MEKTSNSQLKAFSCFLVCTTLLFGCNLSFTNNNSNQDKNDAEKITSLFYYFLKSKKYNETHKLMGQKFFEETDTASLNRFYQMTDDKLGAIDSLHLDHWQTKVATGSKAKAEYALFFIVKRKLHDSKETILLLKENDSIKIAGYNVNPVTLSTKDSIR